MACGLWLRHFRPYCGDLFQLDCVTTLYYDKAAIKTFCDLIRKSGTALYGFKYRKLGTNNVL